MLQQVFKEATEIKKSWQHVEKRLDKEADDKALLASNLPLADTIHLYRESEAAEADMYKKLQPEIDKIKALKLGRENEVNRISLLAEQYRKGIRSQNLLEEVKYLLIESVIRAAEIFLEDTQLLLKGLGNQRGFTYSMLTQYFVHFADDADRELIRKIKQAGLSEDKILAEFIARDQLREKQKQASIKPTEEQILEDLRKKMNP